MSSRRRTPHLRQVTSTCSGRSLPLLGDGAVLDALGRREERVVRALGEDADRHRLRHALSLLDEEGGADQAPLLVGRVVELVVSIVVAEVAAQRGEVDGALLGVELPLHLGVGLAADHALRNLRGLRAGAGVENVQPVDARDELGIVLDVDQRVVDRLAGRIDERPVREANAVVLLGAVLAQERVLGSVPVDAALAAAREEEDEAEHLGRPAHRCPPNTPRPLRSTPCPRGGRSGDRLALPGPAPRCYRSGGMWFHVLAADYDGTLASDGRIAPDTLAALRRVRASGRR